MCGRITQDSSPSRYNCVEIMDPLPEFGRLLLVVGAIFVGAGLLLTFGARLPFRLGHLPGDIAYRGRNGSVYFPIVTCILLSAAVSIVFWIVNHFRR
jgi:hypothetical protein